MPVTTTPPTAAEQHAALLRDKAALGAHLENTKAKRDSLSPSDPAWRKANAEMRDLADELAGYDAAIAELAPKVDAEREAAFHSARVVRHREVVAAADATDPVPARLDRALNELVTILPAWLEWVQRAADAGDVERNSYRIADLVPEMRHVQDVILGRLCAAGILDDDMMPAQFNDTVALHNELRIAGLLWPGTPMRTPSEAAAAASFSVLHAGFKNAIRSADPDAARRDAEHIARDHAARIEREAELATKPRVLGRQPDPIVHTAGLPVSAFSS